MATKSDFAQKLLNDLRLRKERIAATQNSSSSKPASRGAHGNPGIAHNGSKKVTALESAGYRSGNSIRKSSGSTRSFHLEDSSNQIVLYGRGRSSQHTGDLSTAISFGFENGGKFSKIDASGSNTLLNFLHHIGRRSLATGKMEIRSNMGKNSSTAQFPTYSHIHIHDISKGVQKLNQILRTCSNGVNFDTYSIEVGKELLRGAMDLEESLRMLVNLQEASDYMVNSQRKSKIKLIEEDEDDQSEIAKANELRIVACPRFSFDKPRNLLSNKEAAHNDIKRQVMALTYPEETPRLQEKQPQSRSSHSRTTSCVPDIKTLSTHLEPKDHTKSHSKPEKARISNVIAKLMGLEDLSPKEESKASARELSSNSKETMAPKRSSINVKSQHPDQRNRQPVVDNKTATSATTTTMWDTRLMLEAERIPATPNGSSRVVISDSHWGNLEVAAKKYAGPGSKTTTIMTGKQLNDISQKHEMPVYKAMSQEKEKGGSNKDDKEKKSKMKTASKELLIKDAQQQSEPDRHLMSKADDVTEEIIELKRTAIQTRNKNAHSLQTSKQQINQEHHELKQRELPKKSDQFEQKRKQQLPKQKKQANESQCNQVETMVTSKPNTRAKSLQKKKPYDALAPAAAATNKRKPMKHTDVKLSKDLSNSRLHEHHGVQETSVILPPQRKNKNYMTAFKGRTCRVDAASNTRSGTPNTLAGSPDHESPARQEKEKQNEKKLSSYDGVEQETSTHSEEAKLGITRPDNPEKNTDSDNAEDLLHDVAKEVISNSGEDQCQILDVAQSQPGNEKVNLKHTDQMVYWPPASKEMVTDIHEVPEDQLLDCEASGLFDDLQSRSHEVLQNQHRGILGESKGVSKLVQVEHKKIQAKGAAELLTESEKHLKEKLIKGQLFLNTAEALFKLNIPVSILDGNDHCGQDAETKLILDCGSELLKKKGQRQEISVYPMKEMPITYTKVRSFDDLIKQLSKDFNTLKSYGGNGNPEYDTADCLNKMLEKDFQMTHSDVNIMWDFGWNANPFAFQENDEIVKDVEKHILNGLLDEISKELLHIAIVSA